VNNVPAYAYDSLIVQAVTANTTVVTKLVNNSICPVTTNVNNVNLLFDTVQIVVDSTGAAPAGTLNIQYASFFCTGGNNNFTAGGYNLGISPQFIWLLNGAYSGSSSTAGWSAGNYQTGDVLNCKVARNICGVSDTLVSNSLILGTDTALAPGVSIYVNYAGGCYDSAGLVPQPLNGPSFQPDYTYSWYQNGVYIGNGNYYGGSLRMARSANGGADTVLLIMRTGVACDTTVSSTVILPPQGAGTFQIIPDQSDTACAGSFMGFSIYAWDSVLWYKNGILVDTSSDGYYGVINDSTDFDLFCQTKFRYGACALYQNPDYTKHFHFARCLRRLQQ
jgi:hypothetical protein